jgi:hypothetical protein
VTIRTISRRILSIQGRRRAFRLAPAAALVALAVTGAVSAGAPGRGASAASAHYAQIDQPTTRLSHARLARTAISWSGGRTTASTGETVTVYVSASLPPEAGTPQSWADFLADLEHGSELASLTAYIATFDEMQQVCGPGALGCYGGDELMTIGETAYGVTPAEVVRHEYGHHIAFHRLDSPWPAIDWGPKNWASTMNVCRRVDSGTAYPGDENEHYQLNPGEAWAETYRVLEEKRAGVTASGWDIVDGSFYPNDAALQAAQRDVLQPWSASHLTVNKKRFTPRTKRVWTIPLTTPLDGVLELTMTMPKSGLYGVTLLARDTKSVVATGLWSSPTTKRISTTICGERSLLVRVTQRGSFGRVVVSTSLP